MSTLINIACVRTSKVRLSVKASAVTRSRLTDGGQQKLVFYIYIP